MTYTIDITTRTKKNNPSNFIKSNASAYIDSLVLSNLKRTAPYLFGKSTADDKLEDGKTYTFTKKAKKSKTIDITISGLKPKKATNYDLDSFTNAVLYLLGKDGLHHGALEPAVVRLSGRVERDAEGESRAGDRERDGLEEALHAP